MDWLGSAAALAALRPTAAVASDACTRRHASDCRLCAEACPKAALTPTQHSMTVDAEACIGCGLCVTACPVDAIRGVGQVQSEVARRISQADTVRCDVARLLAPESEGSFTDVPCLAAVAPDTLAAGILSAGKVSLQRGPCAACPLGSSARVEDTIEAARTVARATTGALVEIDVQEVSPPAGRRKRRSTRANRATPAISRRSLFRLGQLEPATEPARDATLQTLPRSANARQTLLASHPQPALPQLEVSQACTACGGCVSICPTDALTLEDGALSVSPTACVACAECVRICPEQAISLLAPRAQRDPRVLIQVTRGRCTRCDRRLGPGEVGRCHSCLTRSALTDDIWANLDPR